MLLISVNFGVLDSYVVLSPNSVLNIHIGVSSSRVLPLDTMYNLYFLFLKDSLEALHPVTVIVHAVGNEQYAHQRARRQKLEHKRPETATALARLGWRRGLYTVPMSHPLRIAFSL